jgi:membrane protease YdiL (CAAX protease family)
MSKIRPRIRAGLRDAAFVAPIIILVFFLGLSRFFVSNQYSPYLGTFWLFLVTFLIAYVPTDILIRRNTKSEKVRKFSFVYGLLVGGLIANIFGHLYLQIPASSDLAIIEVQAA